MKNKSLFLVAGLIVAIVAVGSFVKIKLGDSSSAAVVKSVTSANCSLVEILPGNGGSVYMKGMKLINGTNNVYDFIVNNTTSHGCIIKEANFTFTKIGTFTNGPGALFANGYTISNQTSSMPTATTMKVAGFGYTLGSGTVIPFAFANGVGGVTGFTEGTKILSTKLVNIKIYDPVTQVDYVVSGPSGFEIMRN